MPQMIDNLYFQGDGTIFVIVNAMTIKFTLEGQIEYIYESEMCSVWKKY